MKNFNYRYSLDPAWHNAFANEIQGKIINDRIVALPDTIGKGHSYFTQITPAISVLYMNFVATSSIKMTRTKSDDTFYIFHFDFSEGFNLLKINNINHKIGANKDLGIVVVDNDIESSLKPALGKRTVALRVLIDKATMTTFLNNQPIGKNSSKNLEIKGTSMYYYDRLDSKSKLLIDSIKHRVIFDASFEWYLKGISLKLLANFLSRIQNADRVKNKITMADIRAIIKSKNYLLANLQEPFPTILFLAQSSGMSMSKYKVLFKKYYKTTPGEFFVKEKFLLANKMLKSGEYHSVTDIMYALHYIKADYFRVKYIAYFKRSPFKDFVKKTSDNNQLVNKVNL